VHVCEHVYAWACVHEVCAFAGAYACAPLWVSVYALLTQRAMGVWGGECGSDLHREMHATPNRWLCGNVQCGLLPGAACFTPKLKSVCPSGTVGFVGGGT